ncbi:MAG: hypothetical protein LCH84_15255 [Gemmatimonadetes bacterium]|nr:hypothetical protein [Gemmatimonadota bacterium]
MLLALAGLLSGCPLEHHIEITSNRVDSLVFSVRRTRGSQRPSDTERLIVARCRAGATDSTREVMWQARGRRRDLLSVRYGVAPDGFVDSVSAKPLGSGCYNIWTDHAAMNFIVDDTKYAKPERWSLLAFLWSRF